LRKIQPEVVRQIDSFLARAISDAGGKITGDRLVISAVFNEDTISFWFEMYMLIENLKKNIESSNEFFGYSLVLCSNNHNSPELLCRFLANYNGVFVDEMAAKKLLPYANFFKPSEWLRKRKYGCNKYLKINELRILKTNNIYETDIYKNVIDIFEQKKNNVLFIMPADMSIRNCLYKYNKNLNGDFSALTICFKTLGIGALIDIWSQGVRFLADGNLKDEIDKLWAFLFRERMRDQVSEYVERCVKKFLLLVFDYYIDITHKKKKESVLVLENIHLAQNNTLNLLLDVLHLNKRGLKIIGTTGDDISDIRLEKLKAVFENNHHLEKIKPSIPIPKLSHELWEIVYAISVFNRYFPPELFQRLFEEEDKNPAMILKALSILHSSGLIDSVREPRIMNIVFEEYACSLFEHQQKQMDNQSIDNENRVKSIISRRLINWAENQKINPCFRLLSEIADLGYIVQIDDMLLLKAITSDIANNTIKLIESAIKSGQLEKLFNKKADVIRYIYDTSRALSAEYEKEIEKVFLNRAENNKKSAFDEYPVLNAQIMVNFCCYYLSIHDEKKAVEKAKEVMLLGQNKNTYCLPQSYRLFSLICLSKQKINETIEYLGFALSYAEKAGNNHELAISAYYAAAAQFLFGDIFTSANLTRKSIEQSLAVGHPDLADRSRFLEGRLEFELGRYEKAMGIFEVLQKEPFGSMTCEKENLLTAWIYRSKIYCSENEVPKPDIENYDADLFEIEAAYLSGNFKKALELSSVINNPFIEENFLYTEKVDWRSGFAQCEHLYFTHGEIQSRMISLYHALALSNSNDESDSNQALQVIQNILRDEKLCEIDPLDSAYFYAKYRILEQSGASSVDLSTAVSMAFKRLQRRAGRIEDIETRRQYINGSRWNRELSLAAREFKLI
jgi:hypothetical protein